MMFYCLLQRPSRFRADTWRWTRTCTNLVSFCEHCCLIQYESRHMMFCVNHQPHCLRRSIFRRRPIHPNSTIICSSKLYYIQCCVSQKVLALLIPPVIPEILSSPPIGAQYQPLLSLLVPECRSLPSLWYHIHFSSSSASILWLTSGTNWFGNWLYYCVCVWVPLCSL